MLNGELRQRTLWTVSLVAGGFILGGSITAQAADLGSDCCADLEERIAELEATTARKGNRKVSLTISGFVNEAVMWWDDGIERNTYVVTNDSGRTRFRFRGKAKINSDWEAGYRLEIGVRSARSDRVDQGNSAGTLGSQGTGPRLDIRYSLWYLKSKHWGKVNVGQTETAAQSITEVNVTQTKDIVKNSDPEDWAAGFQLAAKNISGYQAYSALEWRRLVNDDFVQPGEGDRIPAVQYVSPSFHGFSFEAAWGNDDYWDVGLWYKGKHHNTKIAAGIAYGVNSDSFSSSGSTCIVRGAALFTGSSDDEDCRQIGGSISALHEPTGLFLNFGAGWFKDELIDQVAVFQGANPDDTSTYYSFQPGIEKKWHPLGKTTVYGEYFQYFGGANDRTVADTDALNRQIGFTNDSNIFESEVRVYGAGIVQGIDNAAMRLYLGWRHYEGDVDLREQGTGLVRNSPIRDLDVVMSGALIKF